jgi:hypothetical protein
MRNSLQPSPHSSLLIHHRINAAQPFYIYIEEGAKDGLLNIKMSMLPANNINLWIL